MAFYRSMLFTVLLTATLTLLLAAGTPWGARAQTSVPPTLRVGVLLSLSGRDARSGAAQLEGLELVARALSARGVRLELQPLDDRSDPETAATHAERLAASDVHALVCCTAPKIADAVQRSLQGEGLPILSLSHPSDALAGGTPNGWLLSLAPSPAQVLARLAQAVNEASQTALLLAPTGPEGDTAEAVLSAQLGERFVGSERYPVVPTSALTPEALLAITRLPGAIVVWGERGEEALVALGARGYTGPLYTDAEILAGLGVLQRARLEGVRGESERVRAVLSPFALGLALPAAHPCAAPGARYRRAAALAGSSSSLAGAYAWDAGSLLGTAFEQALAYGSLAPPLAGARTPGVQEVRGGLRDLLFGLGPFAGASAVLHPQMGSASAAVPASLEVATWQGGGWRPPAATLSGP